MAYVTVNQLKGALANAGGAGARTAAELPDDRLQDNIDQATSEVVGRLSGSFTLPDPGLDPLVSPDTTPGLLRTIILGIAGYLATLEFYGSQPVEERDPVVLRYARAKELLEQVARGLLVIVGVDRTEGGPAATGDAEIFQPHGDLDLAHAFTPTLYGSPTLPPYSGGLTWG